ncbi:E3 ubiquitin-protein ligase MGRN1 [Patella vulgata]|uniref:E3 ubiquitin-protein ligase MGRN1 n=1 Tax=Patella vulgata TaxID=6465 RepID=UPI00217FBBA8|nr:E3 ubiquitin-protein ligase MGRN1 [Patella vulgata]
MGGTFASRRNTGVETVDLSSNNAYRYPPKSGSYFGSHFIMGGERFDSPQPGEYLFGDCDDLNFLGNKPVPFPYPVPAGNEPIKTLKSLVNIRKDSLKLVKYDPSGKLLQDKDDVSQLYNLEFTYDADARCSIRIVYFATEEIVNGQVVYHPKDPNMTSDVFHCKRGTGLVFSQPAHIVKPSRFTDEEWLYNSDKEIIPVVIQCIVEEEENAGHAHITYAVMDKNSEGGYTIKPLKQKQFVDGLCYLLQEIYGIENKNVERSKEDPDDELEDSGAECVICMSDMRDTLILPCRHLCLCSGCAESLRYQASMCPICRVKFRALLQIRAMRKKGTGIGDNEENTCNQEGVPPGYEAVSLIEALNGQILPQPGLTDGIPTTIPPCNTIFTSDGKKGQKKSEVLATTPIEYQKEMTADQLGDTKLDKDKSSSGEGEDERRGIPEVNMSDDLPSPDKSGDSLPRRPALPKYKYPVNDKGECVESEPEEDYPTDETEEDQISVRERSTSPDPPKRPQSVSDREEVIKLYKMAESEVVTTTPLSCGLSTGNIADDEEEDTSEAEPEPDYDDERDESYEEEKTDKVLAEDSNYQPLSLADTETAGSSTEASSYGSNSSTVALLAHTENPEEDKSLNKLQDV